MAENNIAPASAEGNTNRFKEAVCIETGRIFDSCSDKDCLEDLQVFFTAEDQEIINTCQSVKSKSAEVLDVYLNVEPIALNRGFYAADITFYFKITLAAYTAPVCTPVEVTGCASHCKRVILFGGEGSIKTFSSVHASVNCCEDANVPTATLKIAAPIVLGCRLADTSPGFVENVFTMPDELAACFEAPLIPSTEAGRVALVTLGLFTIVTLQRDMQIMVPAYDYCVPEKDCLTSIPVEDPCEMFKRIKFPVEEFFPENLGDIEPRD